MEKYNKFLDCKIETIVKQNSFRKCYYDLSDSHWHRILLASVMFSSYKIGPEVLLVENEGEDYRCIEFQKVIPFNEVGPSKELSKYSTEDIKEMIDEVVDKMHHLGWGHGDLHIFNLGYLDDKIYMLDFDTAYQLTDLDNPPIWLEKYIYEGFDWEDPIKQFGKIDYETWKVEWLQ